MLLSRQVRARANYCTPVPAKLAVCGLFASTSARAEEVHYAGGPIQAGNQCWVSTNNDNGFGYWRDCPKPEHVSKKK